MSSGSIDEGGARPLPAAVAGTTMRIRQTLVVEFQVRFGLSGSACRASGKRQKCPRRSVLA